MISVVITLYNLQDYINKCIMSVLNQTYQDLEIIVVNDCSTDNSAEIVNNIADKRITLISNKENVGAGLSRRIGIENSHGEYIMLLDADDYISENYIESLYTNNTDFDIISGGVTSISDSGNIIGVRNKKVGEYTGDDKFKNEIDGTTVCFLNNKLVRSSLYKKVPYCDRRFIEDTPTLMKLLYYANKTKYIENPGYYYVQRSSSLIHTQDRFKFFIYTTLYCIDLLEFFKDKEGLMHSMYNLETLKSLIYTMQLNNMNPEDFINYKNEWNYIVNYIKSHK